MLRFVIPAHAQQLILKRQISLPATPVAVSLDRYNQIYVADQKGNVLQFDSTGTQLNRYSPPKVGTVSLVEAWKTVQLFLFYREYQQFAFLDRFMRPLDQSEFDRDQVGFARLATVAADGNLWVFDDTDFSLKKYDPRARRLLINTPLSLLLDAQAYDLSFIREYQNTLFISDRQSGILVFDNLGNYKKKLPFAGLTTFGVLNDELYYLKENQIHFFHLYNFTERSLKLPPSQKVDQVLAFGNELVVFAGKALSYYRIEK